MLKARGIPGGLLVTSLFWRSMVLVLILEKECHSNRTDGLARGRESKVARSKVFFSVLLSGLPLESVAQIWDAFFCFK